MPPASRKGYVATNPYRGAPGGGRPPSVAAKSKAAPGSFLHAIFNPVNQFMGKIDWNAQNRAQQGPQPPQTPGENINPTGSGSGGRGGGGGGGGRAGPNAAQVKNIANQLFAFNRAPWLQQYALNDTQGKQLAAYNPDFAGMGRQYQQLATQAGNEYQSDVAARVHQLAQLRQQLGATQTAQMQGTMRDLSAQGFDPSQFAGQANAANAGLTQELGNQGAYMSALGGAQAGSTADALRLSGLMTQGGQATLANNRLVQQNQLAAQRAQLAMQQAQAEQANNQAKTEFMLKYGVF